MTWIAPSWVGQGTGLIYRNNGPHRVTSARCLQLSLSLAIVPYHSCAPHPLTRHGSSDEHWHTSAQNGRSGADLTIGWPTGTRRQIGGDAPYLSPGSVTRREQKRLVIRRYDAQRPGAGDDFGPVDRPFWWRAAATGPGR